MVQITKKILNEKAHDRVSYESRNLVNYITIHETDNTDYGANALNHHKFQYNQSIADDPILDYGWHYQVDDKSIIQTYRDDCSIWHCANYIGNTESVGIELCVNKDGNWLKTVENAVDLVVQLIKKYNLSVNDLRQHYHWSGKNCPRNIRSGKGGITWSKFKQMVYNKLNSNEKVIKKKPVMSLKEVAKKTRNGDYGNYPERKKKLEALGFNYDEVQKEVNSIIESERKELNKVYHKVTDSDTLWGLSRKYNTTVEKLVKLNGIKNPDIIITGDILRIK